MDESNYITGQDINVPDEMMEINTDLQVITIQTVQDFELRERVCKLLVAFLNVEKKNKSVINFSYAQIMKYVTKVKTSEKKSITDMFEKLDPENRRIEDMMKLFKIGRWNVGMQKGLIHYDEETNARESMQLMNFLNEDNGNKDVIFDMMRDVYDINNIGTETGEQMNVNDLETMEENENTQFYENEGYGIEGLDEDYNDGDYYGEDDADDYM
jgi:Lhr-like helicase